MALGLKTRLLLSTALTLGGVGVIAAVPPAGFNWPFATYPITIVQTSANTFSTNFVPESYAQPALTGPVYWVDVTAGNNANPGTQGSPVKSIWKGTQLANTGAVPATVMVKYAAAGYGRADGFSNTSTPVPNTVPIAYIAYGATYPVTGGIVDCWVGDALSWSLDANNSYIAARTNVSQVFDTANFDANGDYLRMVQVADAATVYATPNSWAQIAGNIEVHRIDNSAVTNANTRAVLKATPNFVQDATSKNIYLKGFNFQGGAAGAVAMTAAATLNFIAVNCSAAYAGDSATNVNSWKIDFITGLAAFVNCRGSQGEADGFNTHWTPGGTPGLFTLTINCKGYNNGRDSAQSCNGLTSHDNCIGIDVMGEYWGNYGTNVIPINGNQMWCVGTYAHDSLGDVSHGGTSPPRDFEAQSTAFMVLTGCRSAVSATAVIASGTSIIWLDNFTPGPGQAIGGGGGSIVYI